MDLKETVRESADWIHVAQDGVKWKWFHKTKQLFTSQAEVSSLELVTMQLVVLYAA
jgi:hypothetical protein